MAVKVSYRSKTDLVADALRTMIQSGELTPGTELHQREVADRLGVSPTPVREAFRRLEAEGLVASEPHTPTVVVGTEYQEYYDNALILGALEGLGAELAAKRVTQADVAALVDINESLASATTDAERMALDREFHNRVTEINGSSTLASQINLLWRNMGAGATLDTPVEEWVREHRLIIEALSLGDCSEARDATTSHVVDGFKSLAPAEI